MKVKSVVVLGALALSGATLVAAPAASPARSVGAGRGAKASAWMRTGLAPQQRAALLVAQMTLDEKIAMVHGAGYPLPLNAAGYAGVVPANTRLGIPALYLADSPVGVGNGSTGVTQWADTSALASTWDTALASAYGSAYGAEQAGKGHNIALDAHGEHPAAAAVGPCPGDLQRGPVPDRAARRRPRSEGVQSQHVIATVEALRGQQPGGAAQPHQRGGRPARACTRSTIPPSRWPSRTPASARSCVPTTGSTAPTPARTRRS